MKDKTQPEALRLAEILEGDYCPDWFYEQGVDEVAAELRRQHTRIAELEAQLEAVGAGGVQALSAAPAVPNGDELRRIARSARTSASDDASPTEYVLAGWNAAMLAASPTPPAEQQATKETSGGFHVWRDISTAPKDGSRFVATGHNYGLYSEVRHACVAQWFRGCWIEASDWNETSELKYLTHWMPLPSPPDDVAAPAEQQAAPKAAPGDTDGCKQALGSNNCMQCCVSYMLGLPLVDVPHFADGGGWDQFASFVESKGYSTVMLPGEHEPEADYLASGRTERGTSHMVVMNDGKLVFDPHPSNAGLSSVQCVWLLAKRAAPQQEAQEPVAWRLTNTAFRSPKYEYFTHKSHAEVRQEQFNRSEDDGGLHNLTPLYTEPQPAPAQLSDDVVKDAARWRMVALIGNEVMLHPEKRTQAAAVKAYMDATHSGLDLTGAVDAAIAAQGGTP